MTLRLFRNFAAFVFGTMLLASYPLAQTHPAASESPYGGTTVEGIVARVNDQIITRSDYDRALKDLDQEAKQHGATMQETSEAHKDLLRGLIDQQLWLSKGKELDINGETEMIKKLDEFRKQYNLETLEDLEKAAKEQGVSWEDFKANIRNGIITQEVMRQEVGQKIQITQGEVERYFEQHKEEYAQPESVHLSEILISSGVPAAPAGIPQPDDPAKLAAAQAKADDIEAKLHAGGDFSQLAKTFSDGTTAAEGGDLGVFQRGKLNKVFEDQTFALKSGQFTDPIRTKQGYVILKVVQHVPGGVPAFKDVQQDVEQNYYMSRMEPAMRAYLTQMREEAYIDIAPGYVDTGASPKQIKPSYSAYTPPSVKKKKKVERTRFRETTHFRQKGPQTAAAAHADPLPRDHAHLPAEVRASPDPCRYHRAGQEECQRESAEAGQEGKDSLWQGAHQDASQCYGNHDRGRRRSAAGRQRRAGARESARSQQQANAEDPLQCARQGSQAGQDEGCEDRRLRPAGAGRRRGCRPPGAIRSPGPVRRHCQQEEEKANHDRRENSPDRQKQEARSTGAGFERSASGARPANAAACSCCPAVALALNWRGFGRAGL